MTDSIKTSVTSQILYIRKNSKRRAHPTPHRHGKKYLARKERVERNRISKGR